ncbi:hypothetical protein DENIS_4054 [Desulfonema ishimotonii]|uniref:OmpA-like domain-containing protein n=1 Tax=Desulfonema ishimotonii TaxID=45657 RepID=A0A401G1H8_9BACT|nr:OmpA family protein [Desulfonema ishimotonii]GBC63065.1 hypothetical protein DENIS_4054 [Desulfonema ishimotonii]
MKKRITIALIAFMISILLQPSITFASDIVSANEIMNALSIPLSKGRLENNKTPVSEYSKIVLYLNFGLNSHDLAKNSITQLKELGEMLQNKKLRKYIYRIEGHTCSKGDDTHNLVLSRKRASSVMNYLRDHFDLDTNQFIVDGYGEAHPIPSLNPESPQNRRVEIINTGRIFSKTNNPNPQVRVNVKYKRNSIVKKLREGDSLKSGGKYAIEFMPKTDLYVYVFQADKINDEVRVDKLFPEQGIPKKLKANKTYRLPETRDDWYSLDDNKGTEYFVVLAQKSQIDNPDQKCKMLLKPGGVNNLIAKGGSLQMNRLRLTYSNGRYILDTSKLQSAAEEYYNGMAKKPVIAVLHFHHFYTSGRLFKK